MILGDQCAECGGHGAGPRQLCETCLPLYDDEFSNDQGNAGQLNKRGGNSDE